MASPVSQTGTLSRTSAWLRTHPYTILAGAFIAVYAFPFCLRKDAEWQDVYVKAASHLLHREHLYNWTPDYVGFVYPPFAALLAIPFTFLPPVLSRAAWYLVNVLCLVLLFRWAWHLAGGDRLQGVPSPQRREHLIFFIGLVCSFSFALNCLAHQQTDLVIAALVLGGCVALARSRSWLAATAWGLAAAIKCTALLWSPYLLWRGRWKEAGWLAAVAVGVNLLPNLLGAPEPGKLYLRDWAERFLLMQTKADWYPGVWHTAPIFNQSLAGTITRLALTRTEETPDDYLILLRPNFLPARTVQLLVYGSELLLVGGILLLVGRRPRGETAHATRAASLDEAAEYSVVLLLMLLLSPMSNTQHFATLALPAFCLARLALAQRQRVAGLVLLAVLVSRSTWIKWLWGEKVATLTLWWGALTWSTLLLLLGCVWVLRRRRHRPVVTLPFPLPASRAQAA